MSTNKPAAESLPLERQAAVASPEPKVRLLKKLLAAQMSLTEIKKDKTNEHFKYEYASAATVTAHVRAALHAQGCLLVLSEKGESRQTIKSSKIDNKSGAVLEERETLIVTKQIEATIFDTDTGESISVVFSGDGTDSGDKAPYKAITGTSKYAQLGIMNLASGDDPENEKGKKQSGGGSKPADGDPDKPRESTATRGTADDPYTCYSCGKKHIVEGMKIIWQKIDGKNKASVAECYYAKHPKQDAPPADKPTATMDNGSLANPGQIKDLDAYFAAPKRDDSDKAWWADVKETCIETVTTARADKMLTWFRHNPPTAPVPKLEWESMLRGETA